MRVGGVISALPAVAGPFLLLAAEQHGARFAAGAAQATVTGLLALAAFSFAYGRAASRVGWPTSLLAGWIAAASTAALTSALSPESVAGPIAACLSMWLAWAALPAVELERVRAELKRRDALAPMALGGLLVLALTLSAARFGALVGGSLAALPVLASVLAASTHRHRGGAQALALLRAMLAGMSGFVLFCEAIALLLVPAGVPLAFAVASLLALGVQLPMLRAAKVAAKPEALHARERDLGLLAGRQDEGEDRAAESAAHALRLRYRTPVSLPLRRASRGRRRTHTAIEPEHGIVAVSGIASSTASRACES